MIHLQHDIVCSKCNSVNEHDYIDKQEPNRTVTFTRCKKCGHSKWKSTMTYTDNQPQYSIDIPGPNTPEFY